MKKLISAIFPVAACLIFTSCAATPTQTPAKPFISPVIHPEFNLVLKNGKTIQRGQVAIFSEEQLQPKLQKARDGLNHAVQTAEKAYDECRRNPRGKTGDFCLSQLQQDYKTAIGFYIGILKDPIALSDTYGSDPIKLGLPKPGRYLMYGQINDDDIRAPMQNYTWIVWVDAAGGPQTVVYDNNNIVGSGAEASEPSLKYSKELVDFLGL